MTGILGEEATGELLGEVTGDRVVTGETTRVGEVYSETRQVQ